MTITDTATDDETALWASIDAAPGDQLRRNVLADLLEERAEMVECKKCKYGRLYCPRCSGEGCSYYGIAANGPCLADTFCPTCSGSGYIPDRNGRMAAALRATADKVPAKFSNAWSWENSYSGPEATAAIGRRGVVDDRLFAELSGSRLFSVYMDYPTAAAAIRDLCEAWCKVTYGEVQE